MKRIFSNTLAALGRLGVGTQLMAGFAAVLVFTCALGGVAILGLSKVNTQASSLEERWMYGVGHLAKMRTALAESRDVEVKHSRTDDKSYHSEYEEKMALANKELAASLAAYKAVVGTDKAELDLMAKLDKGWAAYSKAQQTVVALGRDKKQVDAADISDGLGSTAFDDTMGALAGLNKFGFEGGKAAAADVHAVYRNAKLVVAALLGAALFLGLGLAWVITRHLLRQLGGEPNVAASVLAAVAEGDLSTHVPLRTGDTTSLMACLAAMQRSLSDTVSQVRSGSEGVATASSQIAQGNQDLSGRTEQQASALQQTAATMDELGSTVRNNADNARQANQLALGASTVAVKGGEVVGKVVETMKGINQSSKKIADIISVIDGIAFQTNILALNAAVEAARAGEQGRGFAVVAAEVRSLAQRSAEAAKEIKSLISASVERVDRGTELVGEAGHTMDEIVAAIRRVSDIVGEISSASVEQSSGVSQVGQAVTQMDHATQQNAALVEESAAAAESLRQQAQALVQAVAVFKLRAA
jgi:methyl-accepting chemotaxis protein